MAGEFKQLLPFTWRGLHLPVSRIGLSLAHDLVEHKYWGVDGGRVEATGVAPVRISAVIPIANSIVPGQNEKWAAGALYPDALRNFIIEFAKKDTGYVQHPEFGEIAVKPERMSFELAGEKQDCTEISASWVETLDTADEYFHILRPSPVQDIELALSDLNASGEDLRKLAPHLPVFSGKKRKGDPTPTVPEFQQSLESFGRNLTAYVDVVSVISYRVAGLANRLLYQAHRLEVAIQRAGSMELAQITPLRPFSGFKRNALTWPVVRALQKVQAAVYTVRRQALSTTGVGFYTVPAQTTLAGLVTALPAKTPVGMLIKMNPNLVRGPIVPKGTMVRYPLDR